MSIDPVHLHLAINHYPIFALLIGTVLLLVAILMDSRILIKTALIITCTVGLAAIPVFLSGGETEERVEHKEGFNKHYLEEHEELGEASLQASLILSAFALVLLMIEHFTGRNIKLANWLLVLASVIVLALFYETGEHGGKIRHSEIVHIKHKAQMEHRDSD